MRFKAFFRWDNLFYLLSALVMISTQSIAERQSGMLSEADWRFPFQLIHIHTSTTYITVYFSLIALMIGCTTLPRRLAMIASCTMWMAWIGLFFSFDRVYNIYHGFFLFSLGMAISAIVGSKAHLNLASAACLSMYFSSGLWKLFYLFNTRNIFVHLSESLPRHIAYGIAQRGNDTFQYLDFFTRHPSISATVWCWVVLFQLAMPLVFITFGDRVRVVVLFMFVVFHLFSKALLGPDFTPQVVLLMFVIGVHGLSNVRLDRTI